MESLSIVKHFMQSRYRRFADREQLLAWQEKQIRRHLDWVCEHSAYYRDYQGRPLQDFPLMNKARMMENFNALNTCSLDRERLLALATDAEERRDFANSEIDGITVGLSSGTSGHRGLFIASEEERLAWAGFIMGRLLPTIFARHRIALLLRADSPLYQTVNRGLICFHYADIRQPLEQWLPALEAFQPSIVVGSAQALLLCAEQAKTLAPQLMISGAEVLLPAEKQQLAERFACEVKEIYQCTEGLLACTHPDGQMRWNEDVVHIEPHWLNAEKTHFSPIITDFRRRTQPVIRYLLDDVIKSADAPGVFQAIEQIEGRCGDILQLPGKEQDVAVLPDLIYRSLMHIGEQALDYRICQEGKSHIRIESSGHHAEIATALEQLFSGLGVEAVTMAHHPAPKQLISDKRRRVVNQCAS